MAESLYGFLTDKDGDIKEYTVSPYDIMDGEKSIGEEFNEMLTDYSASIQSVEAGRVMVAAAINEKGVPTTALDTFEDLLNKLAKVKCFHSEYRNCFFTVSDKIVKTGPPIFVFMPYKDITGLEPIFETEYRKEIDD